MISTVKQMMRVWWKQFIVALFLIVCLLLLVHILLLWARNAQRISSQVQQQLWVFVYLRDDAGQEAVKFVEELQQAWLQTTFFSKDDAFRILAKKLPNILDSLEKYGINNPLPPTIYIVYQNQEQYEAMKSVVSRFSETISTSDNLWLQVSFQEQTWRASKLVTMMQILLTIAWLLIWWVLVMIGMIISYIVTTLFFRFQQQVEITSLLWWSRFTILRPFVVIIFWILFLSRLISISFSRLMIEQIDKYFIDLLESSFKQMYMPSWKQGRWILWELFFLCLFWFTLIDVQIRLFLRKWK
jgi:cell division protein FtsX